MNAEQYKISDFTFTKLSHCPACNKELAIKESHGVVSLWCSRGDCTNESANNGSVGATEHQAYENLIASFKE